MATFLSIQTRVKNRLLDLPARTLTEIPFFVNEAIKKAARKHDFRSMESSVEFVTQEGQSVLGSKPADFKRVRYQPYMRDGQDGELGTTMLDWVPTTAEGIERFPIDYPGYGSAPQYVREDPTGFTVLPFPDVNSQWDDGAYRVTVPYWAFPVTLVSGSDTNWFTLNAEEYVVNQATAEGFFFNYDETRGAVWQQKAQNELMTITRLEARSRMPGRMTLTINRGARGFGGRM